MTAWEAIAKHAAFLGGQPDADTVADMLGLDTLGGAA